MTIEDIERLLRRLEATDLTSFEITEETFSLTLRLAPGAGPGTLDAAPNPPASVIAKAIGRLRLHHPDAAQDAGDPFPRPVIAGDIVAFLEAGALLRPVVAERDGMIGPPLEPEGALIGYGTALFRLL